MKSTITLQDASHEASCKVMTFKLVRLLSISTQLRNGIQLLLQSSDEPLKEVMKA